MLNAYLNEEKPLCSLENGVDTTIAMPSLQELETLFPARVCLSYSGYYLTKSMANAILNWQTAAVNTPYRKRAD